MEGALSVGGGWVADGGIFHILETLQAFVERRKGGETGVRAVQMLKGRRSLESRAAGVVAPGFIGCGAGAPREGPVSNKRPEDMRAVLGLVEYRDGFRGAVMALDDVSEYLVAVKPKGKPPEATSCYIPTENSNNFSMLVHGITQMIATGKAAVSCRAHAAGHRRAGQLMDSGYQNGKRLETPELDVAYKAPAQRVGMRTGIGS